MSYAHCWRSYCDCEMQNSNKTAVPLLEFMSKGNCWIVSHVYIHPYRFLLICYEKAMTTTPMEPQGIYIYSASQKMCACCSGRIKYITPLKNIMYIVNNGSCLEVPNSLFVKYNMLQTLISNSFKEKSYCHLFIYCRNLWVVMKAGGLAL